MKILRLLALAVLVLTPAASRAAEPVKIRWGIVGTATPSDITSILFANKSILKHHGTAYTVETQSFNGSSLIIPALAAKALDFGMLANSAFAFAVLNANLDIKIVADELQEGVPGWFSGTWYVLEGSPVRQVCDLKGKSIALGTKGTALDLALRVMLKKTCNLTADRDYTIVEVRYPNQETFLREKKVDATVMIPPFVNEALKRGGIRALFNNGDAIGRSQFLVQVARTEFLQQHRAAVEAMMEDYLIAWRWYLDPRNVEQANQYAAAYTKFPIESFRGWAWLKEKDYYRDPDAVPDLEALQKDMRLMQEYGFIAQPVDVMKYADLSFIKAAKARLGK
jgi:ABC-type nitrate/sulfonate/bicarbonate transport system substrate-binding protein